MLRTLSSAALALTIAGSPDAATRLPTIEPSKVNVKHVGMCNTYDPNDPYNLKNGAGANSLSPTAAIYSYVQSYQKAHLVDIKPTDYTVKYIEQPRYGVIKSITKEGWTHELYMPNEGYAGNDRYVAEVTLKDTKFKITGFLRPSADVMSGYDDLCRRLGLPSAAWKISDATDTSAGDTALSISTSLVSALADLAGIALAQTKGESASAQITLDQKAEDWGQVFRYKKSSMV